MRASPSYRGVVQDLDSARGRYGEEQVDVVLRSSAWGFEAAEALAQGDREGPVP